MGTMDNKFNQPVTPPSSYTEHNATTNHDWQVKNLGLTSCDYRRSHIEVFVNLAAGESVYSIPLPIDMQGTLCAVRVRSFSNKVKVTLCEQDVYKADNLTPHPRNIIIQQEFSNEVSSYVSQEPLYFYHDMNQVPNNLYVSIENQGEDSKGISVIFTFGY